jgi:hypothetical protein
MRKHNQDPKSQGSKKSAQTKNSNPFLRAPVKALKFDHELLAAPLIKKYQGRLNLIEKILKSQASQDNRLAKGLNQLLGQIQVTAHKKYERNVDERARKAFYELTQKQFGIQPARAAEYIKVAENKKVIALGLTISSSVEIARLSEKALKQFLAAYPKTKLKKMGYREIKSLTRKSNPKKRNTKSAKKKIALVYSQAGKLSSKSTPVFATAADRKLAATADLKVTFHSFKAANKKGGLDNGSLKLLKEMSAWIEQTLKATAKKSVVVKVRKGGVQ